MYEQRVEQIAAVIKDKSKISSWGELPRYVRIYGTCAVESRMQGKAFDDLVKDVAAKMRKLGFRIIPKSKKVTLKPRNYPVTEADLQRLANYIQGVNGECFPDGDPMDRIYPWIGKQGWDADHTIEIINSRKFLKKYLGHPYKDFYDYLASFWDEFAADNPDNHMAVTKENNPWRCR